LSKIDIEGDGALCLDDGLVMLLSPKIGVTQYGVRNGERIIQGHRPLSQIQVSIQRLGGVIIPLKEPIIKVSSTQKRTPAHTAGPAQWPGQTSSVPAHSRLCSSRNLRGEEIPPRA
jgi:hypothetical protein